MIPLRSNQTTTGKRMAGARALWRANGMTTAQMKMPVIAVVNSFTQFVPGHVHLHNTGQIIKKEIEKQGCFAAEFNTIAIDDGIAMGHDGMLYSLPSRDLIADSVEYMCNAHKADAMICISSCDKITPGMLMAAMRLNIPALFVSGGTMEAGKIGNSQIDLVDVMVKGGESNISKKELEQYENEGCPTCGSCSGMFTANSINCLAEALGMALVGNGSLLATHELKVKMIKDAASLIVRNAKDYYFNGNDKVLPRSIATFNAFRNAMSMDIAMGGSTNTILHLLAIAGEAQVNFNIDHIDSLSRKLPVLCKVSPNGKYHMQDVNRAGGVMRILGELSKGGFIDKTVFRVDYPSLEEALENYYLLGDKVNKEAVKLYSAAPGYKKSREMSSQNNYYQSTDTNLESGCIRDLSNAYSKEGGLAILKGNIAPEGCVVKTAGVPNNLLQFKGSAIVFESQEEACEGILSGKVVKGSVVVIRYEGPKGGPGMQEMLYPTSYLKSAKLESECALITDGRFSGGSSGLSIGHISPEAAAGGIIALIQDGDIISIDIPSREINLLLSNNELESRRNQIISSCDNFNYYMPRDRNRLISKALQVYAQNVSSASLGAIRLI